MDRQYQEKAIDALRDWSKWLIGLDFFTGTGCVVVLERGVSANLKPVLVGAILLVALSALVTALVLGVLAALVQELPLADEFGNVQSIYDYHIWQGVSLGRLVQLQFGLFALGVVFVVVWVALKPPTP